MKMLRSQNRYKSLTSGTRKSSKRYERMASADSNSPQYLMLRRESIQYDYAILQLKTNIQKDSFPRMNTLFQGLDKPSLNTSSHISVDYVMIMYSVITIKRKDKFAF